MTADQTDTAGSASNEVVASVRIAAPQSAVFEFLVDPEKLTRWMGTDVAIDPKPGGQFRLNVTGEDVAAGEYVEVRSPERVSFSWGWEGSDGIPPGSSLVTIDLVEDGTDTVVTLVHANLPEAARSDHGEGWTHYLARLVVAGGGGDAGPDPNVKTTTG